MFLLPTVIWHGLLCILREIYQLMDTNLRPGRWETKNSIHSRQMQRGPNSSETKTLCLSVPLFRLFWRSSYLRWISLRRLTYCDVSDCLLPERVCGARSLGLRRSLRHTTCSSMRGHLALCNSVHCLEAQSTTSGVLSQVGQTPDMGGRLT